MLWLVCVTQKQEFYRRKNESDPSGGSLISHCPAGVMACISLQFSHELLLLQFHKDLTVCVHFASDFHNNALNAISTLAPSLFMSY